MQLNAITQNDVSNVKFKGAQKQEEKQGVISSAKKFVSQHKVATVGIAGAAIGALVVGGLNL